jgi:phosphatidylglycerol---prolipoprotein diacylglyceryl transferase
MYPDLSYLFHDIFGTEVDNALSIVKMFGFMLALAFLASAYVFSLELKRKEREGLLHGVVETRYSDRTTLRDVIVQCLIGFLIGFKLGAIVPAFEAFKENPAGLIFSTQGNLLWGLIGAGILLAMYLPAYLKSKNKAAKKIKVKIMPHHRVGDITIIAAIFGIVGARLFSILENFGDFLRDPIGQLISGSGLTIYGGLILATIAVLYYAKKKQIKAIHLIDAAAPALILGYAVGRMGCQLSGDGDWGIVNAAPVPEWFFLPDWFWSFDYPRNVLNEGVLMADCVGKYCHRLDPPVYPTPLYEIIMSFIIFAVLWVLRKRIQVAGALFFLYVLLNGVERFIIEFIRVNPRYELFGITLSQAQYIALGLVAIGAGGLVYLYRKERK